MRVAVSILCLFALSGNLVATRRVWAQDEEFQPGLIGEFQQVGAEPFRRVDRSVSFDWRGRPADRRLNANPFRARWSGYLMSQANGPYQLRAYVAGKLRVKLGSRVLLDVQPAEPAWISADPIELQYDFHPLEVLYEPPDNAGLVKLFWSGPQFQLEPLGEQSLFHDAETVADAGFDRGALLVRALHCAACHDIPGEPAALPAPALNRLNGNVHSSWVVDWLTTDTSSLNAPARRMPHFGFSRVQAEDLTAFLIAQSEPFAAPAQRPAPPKKAKSDKEKKNQKNKEKEQAEVQPPTGEELLLTLGCLACHRVGQLGGSELFGGGDLTQIAGKRPATFFETWLATPEKINRRHRMPVFDVTEDERASLAAHLATLGKPPAGNAAHEPVEQQVERGRRLFLEARCQVCHETQEPLKPVVRSSLATVRDWDVSCLAEPDFDKRRPGYRLTAEDRRAIRQFLGAATKQNEVPAVTGEQQLVEHNCLACHVRGGSLGLAAQLPAVSESHSELAPLLPAMTPPPLIAIGDKLHERALRDAIERSSVHRDYLRVRMPKFPLTKDELTTLVEYFVTADRIPPRELTREIPTTDPQLLHAVGGRLVTTDGFGCTSCHQVGDVRPVNAPVNARGPRISLLGTRIRREWFERFVRNPLRMIPRMEMPSVQVAVQGVLHDDLDSQLAAVWDVLNTPGFQPPLPNPVRIVRRAGIPERHERAVVLTDVLRLGQQVHIKPLLLGLPNRHNVLFDLETGSLTQWSIGDVARQRTEGKSWYWETAGNELLRTNLAGPDLALTSNGQTFRPLIVGQFPTEFDELFHLPGGLGFRHRLQFSTLDAPVRVTQSFVAASPQSIRRTVEVAGAPDEATIHLQLLGTDVAQAIVAEDRRSVVTPLGILRVLEPQSAKLASDMSLSTTSVDGPPARFVVEYVSNVPVDKFPVEAPQPPAFPPATLNVVPGFETVRLPLNDEFMPTALTWSATGDLLLASLKGNVWRLRDTDADELEDQAEVISDELAAPYGLAAGQDYIDVVAKYGLLRLFDDDDDGFYERTVMAASGWGHTADYHDWAVGLPRDEAGNYYVGLPCQQDQRSLAAAHLRGTVLKLVPRTPTPDNPHLFAVEQLTAGHRFPMGIARSRHGDLFVTDNQGNYNPFNELNHVVAGRRYGFINLLERQPDFNPPLTPPAIDLPHPWTRSVNGICFLDTPATIGASRFGPFEGHLIGCEYDTRRLIRMSLQRVGDVVQGAAYPFSYDTPPDGPPLLGPLVCAVSPDGDLYVGGLRDSGWGGSNNIGEVVRLRIRPNELPCGIAEVRATASGFEIAFTQSVDAQRAADVSNYSLSSYTRVSTPNYGGPDQDRRQETVRSVSVREDARGVTLRLDDLRPNFVYELHLKSLVADNVPFFPAEAHYTLRTVP